jgi:ABC-2 type transport system permease protein
LPGILHTVAVVLPYRYMLSFPVEVATGNLSPGAVVLGFVLQMIWLGAGFALFRLVWGRGVRHYSAVGG